MNISLSIVYDFYPKGISYFSNQYEDTKEYQLLTEIINRRNISWEIFSELISSKFGSDMEDRTNNEPGHILLLYISKNGSRYILEIYLSKLINRFCYYVRDFSSVEELNPFNLNRVFKIKWNEFPNEIQDVVLMTLNFLKQCFPDYELFEDELGEIVPDVSTMVHDIGECSIFNIFFSNYLF